MALVRPDLLDKSKKMEENLQTVPTPPPPQPLDAQTAFYESQLVRERLSPIASLVQILSHLQKQAYSVLHDDSLQASDKLSRYNQLMVKSGIMVKKAKTVGRGAASINPAAMRRQRRRTSSTGTPALPTDSDLDTDSDTDTFLSTRSAEDAESAQDAEDEEEEEQQQQQQQKKHRRQVETDPIGMDVAREMDMNIRKTIPSTYQKSAMELYKLLANKGRGAFNWTPSGELVIRGQRVHGSNIVDLLADAARKKSKVKAPVGRAVFINAVKRLNPTLKHVKNKSVFRAVASPAKASPARRKKKTRDQAGSGRHHHNKIVWRTSL